MITFAEATAVTQTSSHTYTAHFVPEYTVGSVPNGGYVASCFQRAATAHFASTLRTQNQPHTLTLHLSYLRRTHPGPATFTIRDVKLGARTSTLHITLTQGAREEVVAYVTQGNLATETGPSLPTSWALTEPAAPAPPLDFAALRRGGSTADADSARSADGTRVDSADPTWGEALDIPFPGFRRASTQVRFWFPRRGQGHASVADQWMCFAGGNERFTAESLGFVADMFPQLMEAYRTGGEVYAVGRGAGGREKEKSGAMREELAGFWYPTVLMNIEIKKALPAEGVEFLFTRTRAKVVKNGRYDLEVVVLDQQGDVVLLSHHVCFIVPATRNTARIKGGVEGEKSKM